VTTANDLHSIDVNQHAKYLGQRSCCSGQTHTHTHTVDWSLCQPTKVVCN